MKEFYEQYKLPIICGGLGLLLALLLMTLGFFKTLLLLILTTIGFSVGLYLQKVGILDRFFNHKY